MIIKKDTNQEYHSKDSISASGLKEIWLTSVYDYNRKVYEDKPAYRLGTMIHEMILEPEEFKENYHLLKEKIDRRTKAGKEKFNELSNIKKHLVTYEEVQILEGIKRSLAADNEMAKLARKYLEGESELSHYFNYKGVNARVRPDLKGDGFISDIKTAQFNNGRFGKREFRSQIYSFAYHLQATFYADMLDIHPREFKFIWIEKKSPFRIVVTTLNDQQIEEGRAGYLKALNDWKAYLDLGLEKRFDSDDILIDGSLET